jgi:hypothetical protein
MEHHGIFRLLHRHHSKAHTCHIIAQGPLLKVPTCDT